MQQHRLAPHASVLYFIGVEQVDGMKPNFLVQINSNFGEMTKDKVSNIPKQHNFVKTRQGDTRQYAICSRHIIFGHLSMSVCETRTCRYQL